MSSSRDCFLQNAGIVDEDGRATQFQIADVEQAFDIIRLGDIGLDGEGFSAAALDVRDNAFGGVAVGVIVHAYRISVFSREPGRRCADTSPAAGY